MSDLIKREDVAEALYQAIRTNLTGTFTNSMSLAIAMANNLPSVELEQKWIPVSEGLPWKDINVLVTVRDDSGDIPLEYTSVGWRTPDGRYWIVDNEICYSVLAWMPLPEPYKGE